MLEMSYFYLNIATLLHGSSATDQEELLGLRYQSG